MVLFGSCRGYRLYHVEFKIAGHELTRDFLEKQLPNARVSILWIVQSKGKVGMECRRPSGIIYMRSSEFRAVYLSRHQLVGCQRCPSSFTELRLGSNWVSQGSSCYVMQKYFHLKCKHMMKLLRTNIEVLISSEYWLEGLRYDIV